MSTQPNVILSLSAAQIAQLQGAFDAGNWQQAYGLINGWTSLSAIVSQRVV